MTNIVPISDLKNYSEVLRNCDDGSTVYLTKNGRGKYVVQSLAEYENHGGCAAPYTDGRNRQRSFPDAER